VRLDGVSKHFGDVVAADGLDLDIADGEFFTLLGPSGSGKTTCLRMIAGFEAPTAGRVLLHGEDVTDRPPNRRDVNTVFQDYALFPHLSVLDNVAYGLMVRRVPGGERRRRATEALDLVQLGDHGGRRPSQLSGGQRQRVALARALVNRPRVLLLDEPLGALDRKLREEMQRELKLLQQQVGITFVFVTHDQHEALTMSDRIAVFNAGRIEQVASPADLYEQPATAFVAGFVGTSNLLTGPIAREIAGRAGTFTVRPEKIRLVEVDAGADTGPRADEATVVGTVTDVVYLGSETRYAVALTDGSELVVMQQNLDTTSTQAQTAAGRRVRLAWDRRFTLALPDEPRPDPEDDDSGSDRDTTAKG
jgi:putative spermidine/putrescine transport system ATP-binding protein